MGDKRRAFLILGPESSGTKVLAKAFIRAGAAGDGWHKQRFDEADPAEPVIVFRRSYPHGGEWPELGQITGRFEALGYDVRAVVIVRSMQYTTASRRQRHGVKDAPARARRAFATIGAQLAASNVPFVWITYEELVHRPQQTLRWLFGWAGLPAPSIKIKDGNEKYV